MSDNVEKYLVARPPHSGDGFLFAFDDTPNTRAALPAHLVGKTVEVKCTTATGTVRILFGDVTVAVDRAVTSGAQYGYPMILNESRQWMLTENDTHIAGDGSAAAVVEVWLCSGKGR